MGQKEDTEEERANWHWRNSMRPVRFFGLDARAAIPFFVLLFHARLVTFVLTLMLTMVFVVLERRGLSFSAALRAFRAWLLGQKRPAWISFHRKRMRDFG
ncbi:MAG: type IV secretion protein IcmT [Micavibrio aeruginosavorus]|uniref:Type IV secretion protein IcmT n=1 Tax=Micavibrio aeruginosavorus TaxID=349221 RepID=A0A2W5N6N6_9BACT|nr:MAG: type IV secretion protein IcmT [Micavibrio aeruginosavorus]